MATGEGNGPTIKVSIDSRPAQTGSEKFVTATQNMEKAAEKAKASAEKAQKTITKSMGATAQQSTKTAQAVNVAMRSMVVETGRGARTVTTAITGMGAAAQATAKDVTTLGGSMQVATGYASQFKVAMAGLIGTAGVTSLVKLSLEMDKVNISMRAAAGSAIAGAKEMAFLREETNRLGLNTLETAGAYAKLISSAKGTALAGKGVRDIFTAVAEASSVLGLSAADTAGTIRALEQMISKGTVSAEELKLQLGDRLPGAMGIAAASMGKTVAQFQKMMANGEVFSDEFLPKFAAALREHFAGGVEDASQSARASFQRMLNSLQTVGAEIASSNMIPGLKLVADSFVSIGEHAELVAKGVGLIITVMGARLVTSMGAAVVATVAETKALQQNAAAMTAATVAAASNTRVQMALAKAATAAAGSMAAQTIVVGQAGTAAVVATRSIGTFGAVAAAAFAGLRAAGAALVAFLGGPWGAAFAAAAAGVYLLSKAQDTAKQSVEEQGQALYAMLDIHEKLQQASATSQEELKKEARKHLENAVAAIAETQALIEAQKARESGGFGTGIMGYSENRRKGDLPSMEKLTKQLADQQQVVIDLMNALEGGEKAVTGFAKAQGKGAEETAKKIDQLKIEAGQMERLSDAYKISTEAAEEVALQIEVENTLRELNVSAISAQGRAIEQYVKTKAREKKEIDEVKDAREKETRELERQRQEYERLMNKPLENFIDHSQDLVVDFWKDFYDGGIDSIGDWADKAGDILKSWLAEMTTMMVLRPIIAPVVQGGTTGSLAAGGVSAGGDSSMLSMGSNMVSGLKGGFSTPMFAADSFIGKGINSVGSYFGMGGTPTSTMGPMPALSQNFTAGGMLAGAAGNFLANALLGDRGIGATIGSTIGSILGAPGGPIGMAIGSFLGNALGGLFGNTKPSDKTQGGTVDLNTGQILNRPGLTGKKFSQENYDAVSGLMQYAKAVADAVGGVEKGTRVGIVVGNRDGNRLTIADPGQKDAKEQNFGTDMGAFLKALTTQLNDRAVGGANQYLKIALEKIDFKKMEDALKDVAFALDFDKLDDLPVVINEAEVAAASLNEQFDNYVLTAKRLGLEEKKVEEARKKQMGYMAAGFLQSIATENLALTNPLAAALIPELKRYREELRSAAALGADTAMIEMNHKIRMQRLQQEINESEGGSLYMLQQQVSEANNLASAYASVSNSLGDFLIALRIGDKSTASLGDRLNEARGLFDSTLAKAMNGDADAAAQLDDIGNSLLELSKEYNASTTAYAQDYDRVYAGAVAAKAVADAQLTVQQQIVATGQQQIDVLNGGFNAVVAALNGRSLESFAPSTLGDAVQTLKVGGTEIKIKGSDFDLLRRSIGYTGEFGGGKFTAARLADPELNARYEAAMLAYGQMPGFANGGRTPINGPFLVGERGPEVYQKGGGTVTPIAMNSDALEARMQDIVAGLSAQTAALAQKFDMLLGVNMETAQATQESSQALRRMTQ